MQHEGLITYLHRVTRIVAALIADDDVKALGEQIDDLAFAFIPPLGADDRDYHKSRRQKSGDRSQKSEVRSQRSDVGFQIANSRYQNLIIEHKTGAAASGKRNRARTFLGLSNSCRADMLI